MELMLFTGGVVISRVELDTLVDLLSGVKQDSKGRLDDSEKLADRFNQIDSDHSGSK